MLFFHTLPQVQGGFLLVRPSLHLFERLVAVALEGDFRPGRRPPKTVALNSDPRFSHVGPLARFGTLYFILYTFTRWPSRAVWEERRVLAITSHAVVTSVRPYSSP